MILRKPWLVGSLLAFAIALTGCDDPAEKTAQDHIERALQYRIAGNLDASITELKQAILLIPDDPNARALLGKIYYRDRNWPSAVKELTRARDLGANDDDLQVLLAWAWLMNGQGELLVDNIPADTLLNGVKSREFAALRGWGLMSLGRRDEARSQFERVVNAGGFPLAREGLARLAVLRGDQHSARSHLEAGLRDDPEDIRLILLEADHLLASRQINEAEQGYRKALELDPGNPTARLGMARVKIVQRELEDARTLIDELASESPDSLPVVLIRGLVSLYQKSYESALADAEKVLAALPTNTTAMFVAGASSYALGRYESARKLLAGYLADAPADASARRLLAAAQIRIGAREEAYETMRLAPEEVANEAEFLSLTSVTALLSGDPKSGREFLERAVTNSPDDPKMRARLSLMKLYEGDTSGAAQTLEGALDVDPSFRSDPVFQRAEGTLVLAYLREKNFEAALAGARDLQELRPKSAVPRTLAGTALMGLERFEEAEEEFVAALKLRPGDPAASANLASLTFRQGSIEDALGHLHRVLEINPQHLPTMLLLATLSSRIGKMNEAIDWLLEAGAAHPDDVNVPILLGQLYLATGEPRKALAVSQSALTRNPRDARLLRVVGRAQMDAGQIENAVGSFERLVALAPESANARFALARAYKAGGAEAKVRAELEKALELRPDHFAAKVVLGRVVMEEEDFETARTVVAELNEKWPTHPEVREVTGRLALHDGKVEQAIALFEQALADLKKTRIALALAGARWRAEEREAAVTTLEDWIARNPTDTRARRAITAYYRELDRTEDAEAQMRAVLAYEPDDWVANNELAWLLYKDDQYAEALTFADRAHEAAPGNVAVKDTLGIVLVRLDELDRALPLLREVVEILPGNPQAAYHLAAGLAKAGRKDEARDLLRATLDEAGAFDEREDAEALIGTLN